MDIVVLVGLEKQEESLKRLSSIATCFISEQPQMSRIMVQIMA